MTVKVLAAQFWYPVLLGNDVWQDGVYVKVRCNHLSSLFPIIPSENLVMEDLIQNAHSLFDENSPPSEPFPLPNVAETTSTFTYDSLILSPELSQLAEVEALGSTTRHGPGGILKSTQSSFSSLSMEGRFTPQTTRGAETTTQEQVIPDGRGPNLKAVETLADSTPAEVMSVPPTIVDEWQFQVPQSRLSPHPDTQAIPQSPQETVLSRTSDFTRSSATSLQTGMGRFSP